MTISSAEDLDAVTVSNNADWAETHPVNGLHPNYEVAGLSARMQMRHTAEARVPVLSLSTTTGELRFDEDEDGNIFLILDVPDDRMKLIPAGTYERDILIYYGASTIYGGKGTVDVEQGITEVLI
jgi:hypothetical protein